MKTTSYLTFDYTIPANGSVKVNRQFRHIRGISGEKAYKVRFPDSAPANFQTGLAYNSPVMLNHVELINESGSPVNVGVALADGPVSDNRLVGTVDVTGGLRIRGNTSVLHGAMVVDNSIKQLRPAIANRATVLVQNVGSTDIYICNDPLNVPNRGFILPAGGSVTITHVDEIHVRLVNTGGSNSEARFLEERVS